MEGNSSEPFHHTDTLRGWRSKAFSSREIRYGASMVAFLIAKVLQLQVYRDIKSEFGSDKDSKLMLTTADVVHRMKVE